MKLLLIEDNALLARSLAKFLGGTWDIETVQKGRRAISLAREKSFDIIVLDLNLPDVSGQEVCRALRKAGVGVPILVLTGSLDPITKVSLFRAGADDYVTKPFNVHELHARLLALLRRGHLDFDAPYLLKAVNLTLDPLKRHVERAGQPIVLRRKEFDILEYLLRNRGRVVTRSMIMDNVWDPDSDSWTNTVDVHIKRLRDKIDRPFEPKLINTAYGVGYIINEGP